MLSKKALNLKTSPTLFLVAKAKELAAQGHDVISLTVGEPDWPTFPQIAEAGIKAIKDGQTKYTAASGTVELRKAIAEKIKNEININYSPSEIVVGPGAKFVIFSALQMLCNPEDEVILGAPYWVSYPTMIELAGAKPKIVSCTISENFKLTAENLEKAISPRTKIFLFCSPSNPTGLAYSKQELEEISVVLKKHPQICIISDDMYNRLMFNGEKIAPHLLQVAPELKDRVIIINGASKAYSMTGWRMGWGAGPETIMKAIGDYQSQATGAPSSIAQQAILVGLENCENEILNVVSTLIDRKEKALLKFKEIPDLKVSIPDGAFYFWVDISKFFGKSYQGIEIKGSKDFCDILLNKFYVATVPGIESGTEGYMRLSFATSVDLFNEALERMKKLINQLS